MSVTKHTSVSMQVSGDSVPQVHGEGAGVRGREVVAVEVDDDSADEAVAAASDAEVLLERDVPGQARVGPCEIGDRVAREHRGPVDGAGVRGNPGPSDALRIVGRSHTRDVLGHDHVSATGGEGRPQSQYLVVAG